MNVEALPRNGWGRVVLALALQAAAVGCGAEAPPPDDGDVAEVAHELNQSGHVGGAVNAFADPRFVRGTSPNSELYWYMDTRDAALWANDPDCANNDCGNPRFGPIPSGETLWNGSAPLTGLGVFADAMCWAIRNPDHFTASNFGPAELGGTAAPTAAELANPLTRNWSMRAWLPSNNSVAKNTLAARGVEMAGWVGRTNRDVARSALRAAFNACHYAMDQQACGHTRGNLVCNPTAAAPSPDCKAFVETNAVLLGIDAQGFSGQATVAATTSAALRGYCTTIASSHGVSYPVPFTEGVQWAAAERFIRHHTTLPLWEPNGAQPTVNGCLPGCDSGECVGSSSPSVGGEPQVYGACADLVEGVRDKLEQSPLFFMSPQYERDPIRQCRHVSNARTCQWVGGRCESAVWNGPASCVRDVDYFDGSAGTVVVGTCDEGQSFGGDLPASCVNDETNTVPPVPPACVHRCRAIKGYVTATGKCVTTTTTDYARAEQDVTEWVCADLKQPAGGGGTCEPYTQPELCALAGGFCTNDGNNACVRTFTNKYLNPYQQQPTMVWNIANAIGSCGTQNPFNAPEFAPSCTSAGDIDWPDGPHCRPNRSECISPAACCSGQCVDALTGQPFVGSSDGSKGVCGSPGYPGDYAWLAYGAAGDGTGSVSFGNGGSCGGSCFKTVPRSTTLTVAPSPSAGSSFSHWEGCDSVWGTTCVVSSNAVRTVKAFFDQPCVSGFGDVPSNHPFCPYVRKMKEHGVALDGEGCSWGSYCPDAVVSRPQMAAFIVRGKFGENFGYSPAAYFADVPWWDPYFKYVQKLRDSGITMGCSATSFYLDCPSPNVTRGQSAVFLMRAKFDEASWDAPKFFPTQAPYFQDVPSNDSFFRYIQEVADLAITSGCSAWPQKFCPADPVTRGQMAVFVTRAFWPGEVPGGTPLQPGNF